MKSKRYAAARETAEALAALHAMASVVGLLECGIVTGGPAGASRSARRIIAIAKKEQRRQLDRMDRGLEKVEAAR